MSGFIKKIFIELLSAFTTRRFDGSLASNSNRHLKCVSWNNRSYQARPTFVDINSIETVFYSFTVSVNRCGGSSSTADDTYARVCVPDKVKSMNVIVFSLILWVNETRVLVQHESCECKCGLNESACNWKQKRNHDECYCESKE